MINLPEEYKNDMKELLKDEYDSFINSYNEEPVKGLRINTLKIKDKSMLESFNLEEVPWCKEGYYYSNSQPGKNVYHEQGLYYIQEPSAMSAAEALNVEKGDMVLDLCAAPGGKSTQIACKLNGTGLLVSNEIVQSRAKILSSNIERLGIGNCVVTNEDPRNLLKSFRNFFDKILVDAPCSGEGMFRKNPEAINEWSEENVIMCASRQLEILNVAAQLLKNSGTMVFSTCTFSQKENEAVVKEFLNQHSEFNLEKQERLYPHKVKGEGHFYAVLTKNEENEDKKVAVLKDIKQNPDFLQFVKNNLNVQLKYNLCFGDNLYLAPNININGIKVLRCGLHLGELKKNRFEPSHALCLYLKKEDFKQTICLDKDSPLVSKYLQGEAIESDVKGWAAVIVDGYPLGWVKGDGNMAKNHYPKGLRKTIE